MIRLLVLRLPCLALLVLAFLASPTARIAAAERMAHGVMDAVDPADRGSQPSCPEVADKAGREASDCAAACAAPASVLPDPVLVAEQDRIRARHLPGWSRPPASRHPPPEDRPPRSHPAA